MKEAGRFIAKLEAYVTLKVTGRAFLREIFPISGDHCGPEN